MSTMEHSYPDELAARLALQQKTSQIKRRDYLAAFMAARADVKEAMEAGYALKIIWEHMREIGRIPFRSLMRRLAPRLSARSKQCPILNRCKRMAETLLPASWIATSTRMLEISVGFPAAGALLRSDGAVTARNSMRHTREKQCRKAGRMCEVS